MSKVVLQERLSLLPHCCGGAERVVEFVDGKEESEAAGEEPDHNQARI